MSGSQSGEWSPYSGQSYGSQQSGRRGSQSQYSGESDYGYQGRYSGRGPQGYQRSDERIQEDVNEALMWHGDVDASNITVRVSGGEVTLEGTVEDRWQKRAAEYAIENLRGVKDVHNQLRVQQSSEGQSSSGTQQRQGNGTSRSRSSSSGQSESQSTTSSRQRSSSQNS